MQQQLGGKPLVLQEFSKKPGDRAGRYSSPRYLLQHVISHNPAGNVSGCWTGVSASGYCAPAGLC
jgi:hypothetical protein